MQFIVKTLAQTSSAGSEIAKDVAGQYKFDLSNIFGWAIGVGALLALGVIIFGGLKYATSGISEAQSDGKEWIKAAIYGLALLLGAYLILRTINPDILKF